MLWRRKNKRRTSQGKRQNTGRKPHVEMLESRVVFSSGALGSGFEPGGFCTPVPAAIAPPSAEAEFSPAGEVVPYLYGSDRHRRSDAG